MSTLRSGGGVELGSRVEVERAGLQLAEEESHSCRGPEEVETRTSKRLCKAVVLCVCDGDLEAGAAPARYCVIVGWSSSSVSLHFCKKKVLK